VDNPSVEAGHALQGLADAVQGRVHPKLAESVEAIQELFVRLQLRIGHGHS
jgi:hypothetical protein